MPSISLQDLRDFVRDRQILAADAGMVAGRYGKCPQCSAPVTIRENRPNGDDRCANGHVFPSDRAVR